MPSTADSNEYCEPCNAVCNTCTAGNPDECETCN